MSDLQVGQSIELTDGRHAVIRFIGTTHFSDGSWVGIELEDGSGKNDGSVLGERYFACAPKMGMFVRPTAISQILQAAPPPKPANGGVTKKPARPSSINGPAGKRVSAVADAGAGKRLSMNAASPSPAPAPRGSRTSSLLRVGSGYWKVEQEYANRLQSLQQNPLRNSSHPPALQLRHLGRAHLRTQNHLL